jgi:hypothetical protein
LALILLITAARPVIGRYTAILLMFATFIGFNTVLFPQYFVWLIPFIVLAAGEGAETRPREVLSTT